MQQVARRLPASEAQDFIQSAHLKLLERDYDVFRRFTGRSSLRTYLTVVVVRLLLDWRNSVYGKWRPSAVSKRLGPATVSLERLIHRDGHPADEAIQIVRMQPAALSVDALQALVAQLPPRTRHRRVPEGAAGAVAAGEGDDPAIASEVQAQTRARSRALARAVRELPTEERQLIDARFHDNQTIQAIARSRREDPKELYRRFRRILATLRHKLAVTGV